MPCLALKKVGAKLNGSNGAYRSGDRFKHVRVSTISSFGEKHVFVVGGNMGAVMYEA